MPAHVPEPPAGGGPDERPSASGREPQVNLGGADAVQKTTALGGRSSASPDASADAPASVPAGRGFGIAGWVAIVLALAVLLLYLAGMF